VLDVDEGHHRHERRRQCDLEPRVSAQRAALHGRAVAGVRRDGIVGVAEVAELHVLRRDTVSGPVLVEVMVDVLAPGGRGQFQSVDRREPRGQREDPAQPLARLAVGHACDVIAQRRSDGGEDRVRGLQVQAPDEQ
jgi:hypothetical protein